MKSSSDEKLLELRNKAEQILTSRPDIEVAQLAGDIRALVHELSVLQIELEIQNDELRHSNQKLEESRNAYLSLYHDAPVGYLTLNKNGIVQKTNGTFAQMVQEEIPDLIGKPLLNWIVSEDQKLFLGRFNSIFRKPSNKTLLLRLIRKDKKDLLCEFISKETTESVNGTPSLLLIINDITEIKKLEKENELNQTRLEQAQKISGLGYWELDPKTKTIWGSERALEIYGFDIGSNYIPLEKLQSLALPKYRSKLDLKLTGLLSENKNYDVTFEITPANSKERKWVHVVANLSKSYQGETKSIIGVIQDVTTSVQNKIRLEESETNFRTIFSNAALGVAVTDANTGKFIQINQRMCDLLGYSNEELLDNAFNNITHPDDREKSMKYAIQLKETDVKNACFEKRYIQKNGNVVWVQLSISKMWKDGEAPTKFISIGEDITQRKRAEEALEQERERLAGILRGTNSGTWEWNVQTGETIFNERWADIIGYTLEEISPVSIETWEKYVHPDDMKLSYDLLNQHFDGDLDYYECETRMRHKNGEWVWVLDRGKVTKWSEDAKPLFMMGTHQDITERKILQIELNNSFSFLHSLINTIPAPIFVKDTQGKYIDCNEEFSDKIIGLPKGEFIGKTVFDLEPLIPSEMAKKYHEMDQKLLEEKNVQIYEGEVSCSDGVDRKYQFIKDIFLDSNNTVTGLVGVMLDITDRKIMEEELRIKSIHDGLTGLYNRQYYQEELIRLQNSRRTPIGIIVADIDGLKTTNDTFGHLQGDKLLIETSRILKETFRKEDLVARIGGDEFVVILPETNEEKLQNTIKRLRKEIYGYNQNAATQKHIHLSIGYAIARKDQDLANTFKEADKNMYLEKKDKRRKTKP